MIFWGRGVGRSVTRDNHPKVFKSLINKVLRGVLALNRGWGLGEGEVSLSDLTPCEI